MALAMRIGSVPQTSSRRSVRCSSLKPPQDNRSSVVSKLAGFSRQAIRGVAATLVCAIVAVAALPPLLSTQNGLNAALWVTNQTIPGRLKIRKARLGWTRPVEVEDVQLEDVVGGSVLHIQRIITKASLLSIVMGRRGLGDCTISSPWINLLEDQETGLPRLSLAIDHSQKSMETNRKPKRKESTEVGSSVVKLESNVQTANGNLRIVGGELLLPADAAAAIGSELFMDVFVGSHALDKNEDLQLCAQHTRLLPVQVNMWSDCLQAQASGFFDVLRQKLELIKPIKMEMDLTPELGRIYLARVNPLLGYIIGPAVVEEDMPDVILHICPKEMKFPADEYKLRIEPMKVVLARGAILEGLLKLLRKNEEIERGQREIKMETGTIEVDADMKGLLICRRIDALIGGKIHVATWGQFNWIEERMNTKLAIPYTTLRDLLGFSKLPIDYHLQIPVRGTFDRPQIDIKAALSGLGRLTFYQQAGPFAKGLLGELESPQDAPVPEPIDNLPWVDYNGDIC